MARDVSRKLLRRRLQPQGKGANALDLLWCGARKTLSCDSQRFSTAGAADGCSVAALLAPLTNPEPDNPGDSGLSGLQLSRFQVKEFANGGSD